MFGLPQFHNPYARGSHGDGGHAKSGRFEGGQAESGRFEAGRSHGRQGRHGGGESQAVQDSALQSGLGFVQTAKQVVRDALKTMASDVGATLEAFGFDGDAGAGMVKGLTKPLMEALRNGVDFVAQVSLAAVQKTTVMTDQGAAQSISMVAKQLDISVNHSTGVLSVQVTSLELQQQSVVAFGAASQDNPVLQPPAGQPSGQPSADSSDGGAALPGLDELLQRLIEQAREAAGLDPAAEPAGPQFFDPPLALASPALASAAGAPATEEAGLPQADPNVRLQAARTSLLLRMVERSSNDQGEQITRLGFEARVSITRILEQQPAALEALSAGHSGRSAYDVSA